MAKKNKKKQEVEEFDENLDDLDEQYDNEGKPKKRKKGCLFTFLILVVIIGALVAILGFNVGNIRDKYLRPGLEKMPIIKNLLPPLEEEEEEEIISVEQQTIDALTKEIEELNEEIVRLKEFENTQLQFKAEKQAFDEMIALNDPKAYAAFYESIYPENAEELYKQAVLKTETDKEFKNYINTFENMKKDSASSILEELITTDMDLVVTILENLSTQQRSDILSSMSTKNAASVARLLSPQ